MPKTRIITGAAFADKTAEPVKNGMDKINSMMTEIYESDVRIGQSISFNRPTGSIINTPDNPVIDTIPILIISNGEDTTTLENNDSKEGNEVGVWFKTANLAPSYSGFANQILKGRGDLIPDEVCLVWLTFFKLSGIITSQIQVFIPAYVLNEAPVITAIGGLNINHQLGLAYVDSGATALDTEDGVITSDIITTSNVNVNVIGIYQVNFNVADSNGVNAAQVTRTVNVVSVVDSPGILEQSGILNQI